MAEFLEASQEIIGVKNEIQLQSPKETAAWINRNLERVLMVWPSVREGGLPTANESSRVISKYLSVGSKHEETDGWVTASASELAIAEDKIAKLAILDNHNRLEILGNLLPKSLKKKKEVTLILSQILGGSISETLPEKQIKKLTKAAEISKEAEEQLILFAAAQTPNWAGLSGNPGHAQVYGQLPGPTRGEPEPPRRDDDEERREQARDEMAHGLEDNPSERRRIAHLNWRAALLAAAISLTLVPKVRNDVTYPAIGKATFPIGRVFGGIGSEFTLRTDPGPDYIDRLFSEPYGSNSTTLESLARRQIGISIAWNEPLDKIRDPDNWLERQEKQIKLLESKVADDLKQYKKGHNLSDEEFESQYDNIFATVISTKLGLDTPPLAAEVLGIFAKAKKQDKPIDDQDFEKIKQFYQ